ncbi:MAG: helix-turn-helix domain-containing protein [Saprospiraceae bacterium]|nr:helix-turn-helix domain-containing protein [Saprospiraceae bacterium]
MVIKGKEYAFEIDGKIFHCALDITMSFIGGKWKTVVLWYLRKDKKRFSELKRHIPEITEKMLSLQLRQLEQDGLVQRTVFPEVPPRVEYELTEEGKTLVPLLEMMATWGKKKGKEQGKMLEIK